MDTSCWRLTFFAVGSSVLWRTFAGDRFPTVNTGGSIEARVVGQTVVCLVLTELAKILLQAATLERVDTIFTNRAVQTWIAFTLVYVDFTVPPRVTCNGITRM